MVVTCFRPFAVGNSASEDGRQERDALVGFYRAGVLSCKAPYLLPALTRAPRTSYCGTVMRRET